MSSYVAVAAAGSMNVLFTRASEITGGVKVTDESGEVIESRCARPFGHAFLCIDHIDLYGRAPIIRPVDIWCM